MNIPSWKLPPGVCRGTWDYLQSCQVADEYDQRLRDSPIMLLDQQFIQKYLPEIESGREAPLIADFGCGTGRISRLLSPRGYRLLNVDLSAAMLAQLKERCQHPHLNQCLQANLAELTGIDANSLSMAVCLFSTLGMIHGRRYRQQFLSSVRSALSAGSPLIVHVHHRYHSLWHPSGPRWLATSWFKSLYSKNWEFGDRVFVDLGLPCMFLHIYSRRELIHDLRSAGFSSIQLVPISVRGDQLLPDSLWSRMRAGGYFAVARWT